MVSCPYTPKPKDLSWQTIPCDTFDESPYSLLYFGIIKTLWSAMWRKFLKLTCRLGIRYCVQTTGLIIFSQNY